MLVGAKHLKLNRPDPYDGVREFFATSTCIYKREPFLTIVPLRSPETHETDANCIVYVSKGLTVFAADWEYNVDESETNLNNWEEFQNSVIQAFVPDDYVCR